MIKKLQKKFILITMIVITTVVTIIVGGINISNLIRTNKEIDKVIQILVNNNGEMPKPEIGEGEFNKPDNKMDFERNNMSLETPFKTRYFTVKKTNEETKINTQNVYAMGDQEALSYVESISNNIESGYYKKYRYKVINEQDGKLYIFVNAEQELSFMNNILVYSVSIGVGSIIVIFILILVFSKMAVKPIAESYDKQKRFITDANHEIKTPLTIIGATNEVLEMKYGQNEWITTIDEQVKRLTELTEKLVLLSRMEESSDNVIFTNQSVSKVISEVCEPFNVLAQTQNKKFVTNIEENIEGSIDKNLIIRLVMILLDNAFKYSNENGQIEVVLNQIGKKKKLTVKNTVDEIEKGNLDCIFERFYRMDKSRNSSTGGSGIGLSVARTIAEIHKGKITAKSEDGVSIQIEFVF